MSANRLISNLLSARGQLLQQELLLKVCVEKDRVSGAEECGVLPLLRADGRAESTQQSLRHNQEAVLALIAHWSQLSWYVLLM